jgi:hypothetical protein
VEPKELFHVVDLQILALMVNLKQHDILDAKVE